MFVDPDDEGGCRGGGHLFSDLFAVGEDELVVFLNQGDGGERRSFIREGVNDGDDEFFAEIQRLLLGSHGVTGVKRTFEGLLVRDFQGFGASDNGEMAFHLFEGDGDGLRRLIAGEKAEDGHQDKQALFHDVINDWLVYVECYIKYSVNPTIYQYARDRISLKKSIFAS